VKIQTSILGRFENPRRHEQAERDGDDEIYGLSLRSWQVPPGKRVPLMDGERQLLGNGFDWNFSDTCERSPRRLARATEHIDGLDKLRVSFMFSMKRPE